jgi:hypothetical protein
VKRIFFYFVAIATLPACGPRELEPDAPVECDQCDGWNETHEPFRIHGNTWYVGTDGLSSILIQSDDGLILIDGGLPQSAALIDAKWRRCSGSREPTCLQVGQVRLFLKAVD